MTARTPNFDRVARSYRFLEYLTMGRSLERTRLHFLPQLLTARNALVLGDGDGRFLEELLEANPGLRTTPVDSSTAMLDLLRQRCAHWSNRLRICQIDALCFQASEGEAYDLVVTHFFLDCLSQPQLDQLVEHIASQLAPRAIWVVSDFQVPQGALRIPARLFIDGLYLGFRILTGLQTRRLPDHRLPLSRAGFACFDRQQFLGGLLMTELWQTGPGPIQRDAQFTNGHPPAS